MAGLFDILQSVMQALSPSAKASSGDGFGPGTVLGNQRQSPLGYPEYYGPDASQHVSPGAYATTYGNRVFYRDGAEDDPSTQTHERIHVGQNQLRNQPNLQQVLAALGPLTKRANSDMPQDPHEVPAYAFSYPKYNKPDQPKLTAIDEDKQQSLDNYINLLNKLNPNQAYNVLAAMSQDLQKGFYNTGGYTPQAPQVQMQQMSLADVFRRILGQKK